MKRYSMFVGIDISKSKLDVSFFEEAKPKEVIHFVVPNDRQGIKSIVDRLKKQQVSLTNTLFCFENTGVYSMPLCLFLSEASMDYWMVPAIEIKRAKGMTRGKTDKTDSKDIAFYACTHQHKLSLSKLPEKDIQKLRILLSEREKLIKAIGVFGTTKEGIDFLPKEIIQPTLSINAKVLKQLKAALKQLEEKIQMIIDENPQIKQQYELIMSIPGVGPQTSIYLIVMTKCFKSFKNWRQLACYAGVAPFEYSSGSSIKGRTKVSHIADKKMKTLLNLCVLSAKRKDAQLKEYYERKVAEGKNPMLVLNNLRSKLLSRVFAVVNRQTPFVNTSKFAA